MDFSNVNAASSSPQLYQKSGLQNYALKQLSNYKIALSILLALGAIIAAKVIFFPSVDDKKPKPEDKIPKPSEDKPTETVNEPIFPEVPKNNPTNGIKPKLDDKKPTGTNSETKFPEVPDYIPVINTPPEFESGSQVETSPEVPDFNPNVNVPSRVIDVAIPIFNPDPSQKSIRNDSERPKIETQGNLELERSSIEKEKKASIFSIINNLREEFNKFKSLHNLDHEECKNDFKKLDDLFSKFEKEMDEEIQKNPEQAGDKALIFKKMFHNEILKTARHSMSGDIRVQIKDYETKWFKLTENYKSVKQFKETIEESTKIKDGLNAIKIQIVENLFKASTLTQNRCKEQSGLIDYYLDMIKDTFQSANNLVLEQANEIYTKELIEQGWKVISVEHNGDCLFLSLKDNDDKKADQLRVKLVEEMRIKIQSADGDGLKWSIRSLMWDSNRLIGYPQEFKDKVKAGGNDFIKSKEPEKGWQAYLEAMKKKGTFAGEPELFVLPNLLESNIDVFQAQPPEILKDDQGRLYVLDQQLAKDYPDSFAFSKEYYDKWWNSHKLSAGKILPYLSYSKDEIPRTTISVILRDNHYQILVKEEK